MIRINKTGLKALMTAGALSALLVAPVSTAQADDNQLVVFAAASLKNALDGINTACEADVGATAKISDASCSARAKQNEEGAPSDVFISADHDWMKYLSDKHLIKTDTEERLLGNRIVLVAPADSSAEANHEKGF